MLKARKTKWRSLENAAKIFPATARPRDERVFRFACELTEDVQPALLQQALDTTMKQFSLFSCVLRKGVFWYYLEESTLRPIVREEYKKPCAKLYYRDKKTLLFEVTYFHHRINIEVFHALTDGTGTVLFLRTLIYQYLMLAHPKTVPGPLSRLGLDMSKSDKGEDSFAKYYKKSKVDPPIPKYNAYRPARHFLEPGNMRIFSGIVPLDALHATAKQHGGTITAFLTAVFLCAFNKDMSERERAKPVALMIPVNLRKLFPSASIRNFFGWIDIGYDFKAQPNDLAAVTAYVDAFFRREITEERMAVRVNALVAPEQNALLRVAPLPVKLFFLQLGNYLADSADTSVFSNVGKIDMPDECAPYIRLFDFFTTTPKCELCACGYGNNMTMTFTSAYKSTNVFRNFFRMLAELGLDVEIAAAGEEE